MINLEEHAVFIDRLQMEMVPLSVAKQAIVEVIDETTAKLDNGLQVLEKALSEINTKIEENND